MMTKRWPSAWVHLFLGINVNKLGLYTNGQILLLTDYAITVEIKVWSHENSN